MTAVVKEKLTFKEKVESGQFDVKTLNAMIIQFENQIYDNQVRADNKPELRAKIRVIREYLHTLCPAPFKPNENGLLDKKTHTANAKTITLHTEKKITHDRSVTDADVARKFLQVEESARKRGIEFSLNLTTVKNLMKAKKCKYTGLVYDYTDPERSPSFDRVDCNLGYVKGNVVSCMTGVNSLKNILLEHEASFFKGDVDLLIKCVMSWKVENGES
jgi:hypothetical protein